MKIFDDALIVIQQAGGAAVNWRPAAAIGVAIQTFLRWLGSTSAGVAIQQAPTAAFMPAAAGLSLSQAVSGTATRSATAGVALSTLGDLGKFVASMGGRIVQATYGLVRTKGAATAVNTRQSSSIDWVNPNNATAEHNGTSATLTATAIAAADARLDFTQTASLNKTGLAITAVKLRFYYSITLGSLQTVNSVLSYAIGAGGYTVLATDVGAVDYLAAGREFDITAAINGNWASIDTLKPRLSTTLGSNAVSGSANADAVEVIVTANATQVP